jgi:hypothetical protein
MTLRSEGEHVLIYVCDACFVTSAVLAEERSASIPACAFCGHSRTTSIRAETDRVIIYECVCGMLHAADKSHLTND